MQRNAAMYQCALRSILVVLFACLPHVEGARGQDADDLGKRLEAAAASDDVDALNALVAHHRLQIKPVVHALVEEAIEADLGGDLSTAEAKHTAAKRIAAAFRHRFQERSLVEAVSYFDTWSREEKAQKLEADSLLAVGRELRSGDGALRAYTDALARYRAIGDRVGVAEVLGGLGVVYWFAGDPDSTLAYFRKGLEARRAVDDRRLVGNSLNDIGASTLYFHDDYRAALPSYLESARIREQIGDSVALARSYNVIGVSYQELGRADSALAYFRRAVALNRKNGEHGWIGPNLVNVALALMDLGRSSEALSVLDEAVAAAESVSDSAAVAEALNWKGAAYRRVGDFDSAIEAYQQVVRLAEQTGDRARLAYARLNIGVLLEYADRPEQAIRQQEQALDLFDQLDDENGRLLAALGLSNSHLSREAYAEAEKYAELALEVSRSSNDPTGETRALITLGNVQVVSGEEESALENFRDALDRARTFEYPDLTWAALLGHGDYYDRMGEYERAIDYYEDGLEIAESVRGRLHSAEERAGFLAQKRFAYEHIIHMLGRLHEQEPGAGHDRRAFQVAERAKARAFLDMLAESQAEIRKGVDPALKQQQSDLVAEIAAVTQDIQRAAESGDAEAAAARRTELRELEEDYRRLERDIRIANPAYSALQYPEPARLGDVQKGLLSSNTVLLQYALGDSSSALWVITPESASFHSLPARPVIEEQVELFRYALETPDTTQTELFAGPAHTLYRMLLAPAGDAIAGGEHLVVIPDGVLNVVPFEALLTETPTVTDFRDLPYLINRNSVTYGQSASVLLQLEAGRAKQETHPSDLLAFGDPIFDANAESTAGLLAVGSMTTRSGLERLPHSGAEVRAIASLFAPDRVDAYLREDAREERVKGDDALLGYRFIHFATHGLINERRPDFSSIVLTLEDRPMPGETAQREVAPGNSDAPDPAGSGPGGSDPREDGFLQAAEIFNLKMDPDLVVLSACETGLGKMVQGEGIVGLTRAFMYAGAPSIVVSLWRVADESTSLLMQSLYENLTRGQTPKADALRGAKLDMLRDERFAHPFYWAPFVMVGSRH